MFLVIEQLQTLELLKLSQKNVIFLANVLGFILCLALWSTDHVTVSPFIVRTLKLIVCLIMRLFSVSELFLVQIAMVNLHLLMARSSIF